MQSLARFLVTPILAGLAMAVVFLLLNNREQPVQRQEIVLLERQVPAVNSGGNTGLAETPQQGLSVSRGDPVSYADAVARAQPAVVNIFSTKMVTRDYHPLLDDPNFRRFFGLNEAPRRERMLSSLGSGVIVSPTGYVLTNNHVISGADEILVALADGRETHATVVGTDPETDLALLFIEMPDLPAITLAKSETIRVGDVALAIGNPFGQGQAVTKGIISAVGRHNNLSAFVDFLQTDAAINPGNSGGALINAEGDLVGINTAIFSKTGTYLGIGFAIPVDTAKSVMMELLQHGQVIRGWLGVEPQVLSDALIQALDLPDINGVFVRGIYKNGPAHKAGIRPGDIITHINGGPISDPKTAMNLISSMQPGDQVTIRVIRQREPLEFMAVASSRPVPSN
ncbi:MAG TPA: trypsin-like peptidase domain-containing protein [Dongiaceae bacterium]|nr:trypsin-like peptidase domain-containing protein [Dongiaceae bacterium]